MKSMKNKNAKLMVAALVATMTFIGFGHQSVNAQNARMGVKGGLNVSNFSSDGEVNDKKARLGYNVGVYGQILSTDVFAIQLELLYSTKGNDAMYNGTFVDRRIKVNLGYLDLPLLAVIKLGDAAEIHAGAYASYLLSADFTYDGVINAAGDLNKDKMNSLDYGLLGGVGFNFGAIQVGARYNYGLARIVKDDDLNGWLGKPRNSVGQIYLAFNFAQQ